jgi:zinc transport system substrate-binding protein
MVLYYNIPRFAQARIFTPMLRKRLIKLAVPALILASPNAFALEVVTSIRPIQILTQQIAGETTQVAALIGKQQNPHHFQLKPSQLRKIARTDLLIWISDDFETGLKRIGTVMNNSASQLRLIEHMPAKQLIGRGHDIDGHLWLAPDNIIIMSRVISNKLAELDPQNAGQFRQNQQRLETEIQQWSATHRDSLQAISGHYVLDHPFLNYFERAFQIHHSGALQQVHGHSTGLRHLSELQSTLDKNPPSCLLVAQLPLSRQARLFSEQHQLKVHHLDILDQDQEHATILQMLDSIAQTLEQCRS